MTSWSQQPVSPAPDGPASRSPQVDGHDPHLLIDSTSQCRTGTDASGQSPRPDPDRWVRTPLSWYFAGELGKYLPGSIWPLARVRAGRLGHWPAWPDARTPGRQWRLGRLPPPTNRPARWPARAVCAAAGAFSQQPAFPGQRPTRLRSCPAAIFRPANPMRAEYARWRPRAPMGLRRADRHHGQGSDVRLRPVRRR